MENVLDLCCGAGGLSLGFKQAGYEVLAGVDVWGDALDTFRHNHASVGLSIDMHITDPEELPVSPNQVDVVVGGPPCKGFSLAGERDESDERNRLVERFLDYVEYFDPEKVVMENVVGILSMDTGDGEEVTEYVHRRLETMGYYSQHQVLNATDFGIAQTRRRVFFIGLQNSEPVFPEGDESQTPAVEDVLVRDFSGTSNHTFTNHRDATIEKMAATNQGESVYDSYTEAWYRLVPDEPAPTIKENHNAPFVHPFEDRVGTPRECAAIQTFPDSYRFIGAKSSVLKQIGNAVPPELAMHVAKTIR